MYEELDLVNRKIEFHSNIVKDMKYKLIFLGAEKEKEKIKFEEIQMIQKIKYEDLYKKFKELQRKSNDCENIVDERQYQFHSAIDRKNKEKENVENMELYLFFILKLGK